jgi:hypothetical protein
VQKCMFCTERAGRAFAWQVHILEANRERPPVEAPGKYKQGRIAAALSCAVQA